MEIRYLQSTDRELWYTMDRHLPESVFAEKVRTRSGYMLFAEHALIGILRYNLFWDNIPFCTQLVIAEEKRHTGCGKMLMEYWQRDMKARGYDLLLVSTQADEEAQHFYRKLGYQDCGGLILNTTAHAQPTELFLMKPI